MDLNHCNSRNFFTTVNDRGKSDVLKQELLACLITVIEKILKINHGFHYCNGKHCRINDTNWQCKAL